MTPERGDVVEIHWVDIFEDPTGNPERATLARRSTLGRFWEARDDNGIPVIVTTNTLEPDPSNSGFCIYPAACVTKVEIIKRRKRARKAKVVHEDRP